MKITSETKERSCNNPPHAEENTTFQNSPCTLCVPMFCQVVDMFSPRKIFNDMDTKTFGVFNPFKEVYAPFTERFMLPSNDANLEMSM